MDGTDITDVIAELLTISAGRVQAAVRLLEDGCTIPFIARYRKDQTFGLDEGQLRHIEHELTQQKELRLRRNAILKSIEDQGRLTDLICRQVMAARSRTELETLYLPFRPKRKTRASMARDQGLQPLADTLRTQQPLEETAGQLLRSFVSADRGVTDERTALQGACDIVAEEWSEDGSLRHGH